MKLRFFVAPPKLALASELVGSAPQLEAVGFTGLVQPPAESTLTIDLAASASPEAEDAVRKLAEACAGLARVGASVRCELVKEPAADTPALVQEAVAVAPAAAFHDLDGARVHEALPKVLAHVAQHRWPAASRGVAGELGGDVALLRGNAGTGGKLIAAAPARAARFVALDPERGAQIAVVERLRALVGAGAMPRAVQAHVFVPEALTLPALARLGDILQGLAEACAYFELGLTGVPLTGGAELGLQVAAIGVVAEEKHVTRAVVQEAGENLVLLGEAPHELGGSHFVAAVHGLQTGPVPELDLAAEKRLNKTLLALIKGGVLMAVRHVAGGGLLGTAAAMLLAAPRVLGAKLDVTPLGGARADALLFGESQGRVLVAVAASRVGTVLTEAQIRGVPAVLVGEVTETATLNLKTRSLATEWSVADLRATAGS
ncbi:AIR synthase-related protein [Opitutus terrae]|uniref:AIR synthase related protein domain protein n=1 Tax=Opitutus terrae (strain DSM 11246 / JCM 15787 / PB90-1) TaxID=452637 RepID=B1ZQV5_OPITP|nr:AIR synthase-related protein [Opitutus terrae]ACB77853.1 AIR synthase related protein domain protein [Opitutus terrae PB90-1]